MSILYGDYICPKCYKEEKIMHELDDSNNVIIFPGQPLSKGLNISVECEFCNYLSDVIIKVENGVFLGFCEQKKAEKFIGINNTKDLLEKWKAEKTISIEKTLDFNNQPFKKGKEITFGNTKLKILKVFRIEWIEKDIDQRIENPRPDVYWYEVIGKEGKKKWLKVENIDGENTFLSDSGLVIRDEKEIIEDITDNPEGINQVYKTEWFGNRTIEAYQYNNGIRILVFNYKDQTEMDIFEDTFEEAMKRVEENMELGFINE
ncbi:hypothetical protein AAGG74_14495 [Bacillus mexicanus]|uniref:hypothetical protein n=1 Tax=Bacillus mexicanus TaxID=2834415 RepID=UPI003D19E926